MHTTLVLLVAKTMKSFMFRAISKVIPQSRRQHSDRSYNDVPRINWFGIFRAFSDKHLKSQIDKVRSHGKQF